MVNWFFSVFILFVLCTRMGELFLSKRNEKWLLRHGAIESGQGHYPFMLAIHSLYFGSLITEFTLRAGESFSWPLLAFCLLLYGLKAWVIISLGRFWTTKIYRIPNRPLVKKGPYRYVNHPNYLIVLLEIAFVPLTFHLYVTAIFFSWLNIGLLFQRIQLEDKILRG